MVSDWSLFCPSFFDPRFFNCQYCATGVGGNFVAIQSSRMSTYLHKHALPRQLPNSDPVSCTVPGASFFSETSVHTKMARILLALAIPSHFLFLLVTEAVNQTYFMTTPFVTIYLAVGIIHVAVLLQLAYNFVHWLWKMGVDPDSSAIPFLTSFADFIGTVLLATAFIFLTAMGDKNAIEPQNTGTQGAVQYHWDDWPLSETACSEYVLWHSLKGLYIFCVICNTQLTDKV